MANNDYVVPIIVSLSALAFWLVVCVVDFLHSKFVLWRIRRKLDATGGQPTYRETHSEHGEDYPSN